MPLRAQIALWPTQGLLVLRQRVIQHDVEDGREPLVHRRHKLVERREFHDRMPAHPVLHQHLESPAEWEEMVQQVRVVVRLSVAQSQAHLLGRGPLRDSRQRLVPHPLRQRQRVGFRKPVKPERFKLVPEMRVPVQEPPEEKGLRAKDPVLAQLGQPALLVHPHVEKWRSRLRLLEQRERVVEKLELRPVLVVRPEKCEEPVGAQLETRVVSLPPA